MPVFEQIAVLDGLPGAVVDLDRLAWVERKLEADFSFGVGEPQILRVTFERIDVVRCLNDSYWSTEEPEDCPGIVQGGFAYEVTGGHYWKSQSCLINDQRSRRNPLKHFAFLTGWTCVDVISDQRPTFRFVEA